MKTPLTAPGRPEDVIARWSLLESTIVGEHETFLLSLLRHIALGCSLCRQEEIIDYLVSWPRQLCTIREALVIIDVLMAQYLLSEQGQREMLLLHQGKMPLFRHEAQGPAQDDGF